MWNNKRFHILIYGNVAINNNKKIEISIKNDLDLIKISRNY